MNKRSLILWSVALLVIASTVLTVCIVVSGRHKLNSIARLQQPVSTSDHATGSESAALTLVVYSDFVCQSCADTASNLEQLQSAYGDRLRIVYRHFPLPAKGHENSGVAACAAEAAGKQGKFFEMHKRLFAGEAEWSKLERDEAQKRFCDYALELGLDGDLFRKDLLSSDVLRKVLVDVEGALNSNAPGTPALFLNERLLPANLGRQRLKEVLDAALR